MVKQKNNGTKNEVKIAAPLKYLINFCRLLEIPLINCKVELSLNWIERCLLTVANITIFEITDAKLYVPIVTLSAEDNAKLSKLFGKGFKIVEIAANNEEKYIRELLDSSYQGVKRLFVLAYNNKEGDNKVSVDSYKIYFLPRVKIKN